LAFLRTGRNISLWLFSVELWELVAFEVWPQGGRVAQRKATEFSMENA
jgi:hypothetical protein